MQGAEKEPPVRPFAAFSRAMLAALFLWASAAAAAAEDVRDALAGLARTHGFTVSGLAEIGPGAARPAGGDVRQRIDTLLADYNYLLSLRPDGGVARVEILGRKRKRAEQPWQFTIETQRRGAHHVVTAVLTGRRYAQATVPLIVDTGASTLVLPMSMLAELGYDPDDLADRAFQTANGRVAGKLGTLASVRVGGAFMRDVAVAFIDDARLSTNMLLGMSFLGRYRLTIDDDADRIMLVRKR